MKNKDKLAIEFAEYLASNFDTISRDGKVIRYRMIGKAFYQNAEEIYREWRDLPVSYTDMKKDDNNNDIPDDLYKAFAAACNMYFADVEDNYSTCASFRIKPFNTHWDITTLTEVMEGVKRYIYSWVISPMERSLDLKMIDLKVQQELKHIEKIDKEDKYSFTNHNAKIMKALRGYKPRKDLH